MRTFSVFLILSLATSFVLSQPGTPADSPPAFGTGVWLISWIGREEVEEQAVLSLQQVRNTATGRLTFGRALMTPNTQEIKAIIDGTNIEFDVYRQRGDWHVKTYRGELLEDGSIVGTMDPPAEGGPNWSAVPHNDRVQLQIVDVAKKILRVTHELVYTRDKSFIQLDDEGRAYAILNNKGYAFATGPVKVLSVTDQLSDEAIDYSLVPSQSYFGDTPNDLIRVYLPDDLAEGEQLAVKIVAEAEAADDINWDSDGQLHLTFKSGFRGQVEIPLGHTLVSSSQSGYWSEREGRLVWNMDYLDRRVDFEVITQPGR